jgi:flagellar biosynthesis/type III secretory pathway protein FliH
MHNPMSDFDNPWKEALEEYLPDFLALCFPAIHTDIDWSVPPTFLNAELQQLMREAEGGMVRADKLVQVTRLGGREACVLVHIEVQSQEEARFAQRMYSYNARVFDRYEQDVASLGVLADERASWRPQEYRRELWDCSLTFRYSIFKLADWRDQQEELAASDNPFATVLLAHLAAQETRHDVRGRQRAKLALVRRLYERGYDRQRVLSLFRFIDWLLALPAAAEQEVRVAIAQLEEERKMPYITSIERLAAEEARQEGHQEGLQEGRAEEARRAVLRVVARRFGAVPSGLEDQLSAVTEVTQLETLHDVAITAASIEAVWTALEAGAADGQGG